jgi:ribosomal protein S18 acetylase RimI-like enzyme
MIIICKLQHQDLAIAESIHRVQMLAYAQEARLIGVLSFPPLEQTATDIVHSRDNYHGAFVDQALVGALGLCQDHILGSWTISSLVVHPEHQGHGIGDRLLAVAVDTHGRSTMTVSTAAANLPAISLYTKHGFAVFRRKTASDPRIELIELVRRPVAECR